MQDRVRYFLNRIKERLWVKPLFFSMLSIAAVFVAKLADRVDVLEVLPQLSMQSIQSLLTIMASSMLVIATFAVGSMVSAYGSASTTASPRTFPLMVADDTSQRALTAFIGAFIYSCVALVATKNEYFGPNGVFTVFAVTVFVFAVVIVIFLRWMDCIARLGRMGNTIRLVETYTALALKRRHKKPALGGVPVKPASVPGKPIYAESVGYVQYIDMAALQSLAEESNERIRVAAQPGKFVAPGRVLAYISQVGEAENQPDTAKIIKAFKLGDDRVFDEDPRYGLIILSQIAGRALSPGVNDPGTAIDVIGIMLRLLHGWFAASQGDSEVLYDRVEVPDLAPITLMNDAFLAVSRDGSHSVEVAVRLQRALASLASINNAEVRQAAQVWSERSLLLANQNLQLDEDKASVKRLAEATAGR